MKRSFFTIITLAACAFSPACQSMLDDVKPKHAIPSESLTDDDLGKLTNGVLYQMEDLTVAAWFDGDYLAENFGDGPGFSYSDVHADTASTSSATAKSRWQAAFTRLNSVNELLAAANKASASAAATEAKGTAYFCRAYIYYLLVTRFGNVPLITEPTNETVPISEQSKVWTRIVEDLKSAAGLLGDFHSIYFPSKEACYAMLAKVSLWLGDREEAINYAETVFASGRFKPATTSVEWASMFISGTSSSEIIFALANERSSSYLRLFERTNDTDGSWNYSAATELFYGLYADNAVKGGDIRKDPTFNESEPSRIIKFPNGNMSLGQFIDNNAPSSSPLVVLRLADVYLTKAEAQGNTDDGKATLKEFMGYRYENLALPETMTDLEYQNMLLDENQREFYAEGRRWFDIKRTGRTDLYKEWNGRDHLLLWPIPQDERDLAGHDRYPQNPGYAE